MGRAEIRRARKQAYKANTATYNLTKAQLSQAVQKEFQQQLEVERANATSEALALLLALPLKVLMTHYWSKSYAKKLPEFTNHVIQLYEEWQDGKLDMDELKAELWEHGGIRLE